MNFLDSLPPDGPARDAFLLSCIAAGMVDPPTWILLQLRRVDLEVSADYLTILGEHVPMAAHVAQAAAEKLGGILPTPAIVDAIERAAVIVPMPTWSPPPGQTRSAQTSGAIFAWCEEETRRRFAEHGVLPGRLVAGHRKDVVLAGHMLAGHVTIYGGRWPDGRRIQPVSAVHEGSYEDYSHGVRVVRERCWLDGEETTVTAILSDPRTAPLLGGPVAALRYSAPELATAPTDRPDAPDGRPTSPAPPPGPRVLRIGMRGEDVRELQRMLTVAGFRIAADGIFGALTEAAVRSYQGEMGLTQDGLAGARTMAALRAAAEDDTEPGSFEASRMLLPLGAEDRVRLFGAFEWEPAPTPSNPEAIRIFGSWVRDNITVIEIPSLRGKGYAGERGRVTCHRLAAPVLQRFFAEVERAGLSDRIVTYDGCWVPRLVRGGTTLSNHSFGIDVDLNAQWNARGTMGAPRGGRGSVVELLPIAHACGLGWGGAWRLPYAQPDPMHFSVRTPET